MAHAFHRVPNTRVVVLYPDGRVSPTQEAQLTMFNGERGNVRAYAVSSDGGSTGQLVTAELRWNALRSPRCSCGLKLLYDVGHIRLNANDDFPLAPEPNSFFLQGVGIGAYGSGPDRLSFSVTVVRKIGGDASAEIPTADAPDGGLTGARQDTRVWGSLTWQF